MKKLFLIITLSIFCSTNLFSQKIDLGFQASIPSYGISLKADLTETHTVQVIYGALGVVTNFSGRYRYNFSENENSLNVTPFIYAQAGTWSYDFDALDISENILKNDDERKKISDQLFDERTLVIYKEIFKLKNKSISYDDFVKLASEK